MTKDNVPIDGVPPLNTAGAWRVVIENGARRTIYTNQIGPTIPQEIEDAEHVARMNQLTRVQNGIDASISSPFVPRRVPDGRDGLRMAGVWNTGVRFRDDP